MNDLERALGLLGPLKARIMRLVWEQHVPARFVVRDVTDRLQDLAYTTVMTTVRGLADKGPLTARAVAGYPFLPSGYNRVISQFGHMYLPDPAGSFANLARALTEALAPYRGEDGIELGCAAWLVTIERSRPVANRLPTRRHENTHEERRNEEASVPDCRLQSRT